MILTRAPLRLTFGGGATDVTSFSETYGGFCISAAINKYSYVGINRTFSEGIFLKYAKTEKVSRIDEVEHPIIRECLKRLDFKTPQIEVVSMADVPSDGSGLGGSGSFTVALLKALSAQKNKAVSAQNIAETACDINMNTLGFIQGKQDEYICSFGGIMCLVFHEDKTVSVAPLKISHDTLIDLEDNLMLFYTGIRHDTNVILKVQDTLTKDEDIDMIHNLRELKEIGYLAKNMLESGKIKDFADLLNVQWNNKKFRNPFSEQILEEVRDGALKHGAIGVKLVGSGNGGFFMIYAEDKSSLRKFMKENKMEEMRFGFDFSGVKQIV